MAIRETRDMGRLKHWLFALLLGLGALSAIAPAHAVERDLPYGPDPEQRLDLAVPAGKGFPTVVFVHGGSLSSGDKSDEDYRNVCASFPAAGIACASMNYRLAPRHTWPAAAEDVADVEILVEPALPHLCRAAGFSCHRCLPSLRSGSCVLARRSARRSSRRRERPRRALRAPPPRPPRPRAGPSRRCGPPAGTRG